jgi:hypothetical protein
MDRSEWQRIYVELPSAASLLDAARYVSEAKVACVA